jgi:phosphoribosylaminoimidazolecarboxamide formyltransferase / IMP cyclohydrolase
MNLKKIKRAIISVSDKSQLKLILPILKKFNIEIISSGGSFKKIKSMNYKCIELSNYTGFDEMLNGRVKTLHPKIHAGILNIRNNKKHRNDLKKYKIPNIDLVIVDLYPFEKHLKRKIKFDNLIEYIDIGGVTLIRSAAKNYKDVTIISNFLDYTKLVNELKMNKGSISLNFRKHMSAKAFSLTAYYDSLISNKLNDELKIKFPEKKTIYGKLVKNLRYGENPHQEGSLYVANGNLGLEKIYGKNLGYNNYNDIFSALDILNSFKKKGTVIIKHANPCGVALDNNQIKSFNNALNCDPVSAFGGVVAINSVITKKLALSLSKIFFEVIVSIGFENDALKILKKKNVILLNCKKFNIIDKKNYLFLENAFLVQDKDNKNIVKKLKIVSKKKPTSNQLKNLLFAFNVCKFVKSNAIVLANNKSTIGIGAGQPSRLDSCNIASTKALSFSPKKLFNSVAASDAFFPFADGIKILAKAGVKAIIQPGGSINDKKIIEASNNAGIVMIFAGKRHFRH